MARNAPFNLGPLLEKEKLTANGSNYANWIRGLRIVLRSAKKEHVLVAPLPVAPADDAPEDVRNVYATQVEDSTAVQCLMLTCMDPELQKRFENTSAHDMIVQLGIMYEKQARADRYEITKALWECKMAEGSSASDHVIKMVGYAEDKGTSETGTQEKPEGGASKETECFYCKKSSHWKRNCKKYLADKKSGASGKSMSVIHVIDVLIASADCKSWVFDTGSVVHICNSIQGLQEV